LYEFLWIRRTSDYIYLNAYYCKLFSSRVKVWVKIRFSVWFVSGYARVFTLLSVVIVTLLGSIAVEHAINFMGVFNCEFAKSTTNNLQDNELRLN